MMPMQPQAVFGGSEIANDVHSGGIETGDGNPVAERVLVSDADGGQAVPTRNAGGDRLEVGDHYIDAPGVKATDVGVEPEKIQAASRVDVLQPSALSGKRQPLQGDERLEHFHLPEQRRVPAAYNHLHIVTVGFQIADDFARPADVAVPGPLDAV